jgi:cell division septation protein DedD
VKKEPAIETTSTPPSIFDASLPYHIIAGSFGSEANANKLADKLRSDGFAETTVSMNSGMYRVSIKGFSSIAAANSELQTIRSKVANAWVMKMK